MKTSSITRSLAVSALAAAALVPAQPAQAADELFFDPNVACPDFVLGFLPTGGNLHTKEFEDKNGNVVRILTAGKGTLNTYTNYGSDPDNLVAGKSISIRTDGSVTSIKVNPDKTLTYTTTGHFGLIMFPSDVPAGPSTTQYIGRLIFTVDPVSGVFTVVSASGTSIDVCEALES